MSRQGGALLVDRGGEFRRPGELHDLTDRSEPLRNHRVGGGGEDVLGNALTQLVRHAAWTEQSIHSLQGQGWVAGFESQSAPAASPERGCGC